MTVRDEEEWGEWGGKGGELVENKNNEGWLCR
jgi:hypothetical protein